MTSLAVTLPDELVDLIARRTAELMREQRGGAAEQPSSPWLTFEQACTYLGFSRDSLYKLTAARAIPLRKKVNGQGLRFHRDELNAWMETHYPRLDRLA